MRRQRRQRKRVLEWASKEIRLLGSDDGVMTWISGMVSVSATASDLHSQGIIRSRAVGLAF